MSTDSTIRFCRACGFPKSLSEFPEHPTSAGGRLHVCRDCHNAKQRLDPTYTINTDAGRVEEQPVINLLRAKGIYAVPGKQTHWKWVDVVAWGCVRVEVKSAQIGTDGNYVFNLSPQRRNGLRADVVILVCVDGDKRTYHTFSAECDVLYDKEGLIRSSVIYYADGKQSLRKRNAFTDEMMLNAKDDFSLIETKRQEIMLQLVADEYHAETGNNIARFKNHTR